MTTSNNISILSSAFKKKPERKETKIPRLKQRTLNNNLKQEGLQKAKRFGKIKTTRNKAEQPKVGPI